MAHGSGSMTHSPAGDGLRPFAPPLPPDPVITPGRRYLFKRSKRSYPDQFWGEIVAYRIGCLMGLSVPPAFVAWNSETGISGALIEWFYRDGTEAFVMAGDFLLKVRPEFDRDRGTKHNLRDNALILRAFAKNKILRTNWRQWWVDALLFDALIGNTDRHQDNWGFVISSDGVYLAPLFDNGTSLGHERFPDCVGQWTERQVNSYIAKGIHHVMWSLADTAPLRGHKALLERTLGTWPETRSVAGERLKFCSTELSDCFVDLLDFDVPVRFTAERRAFMLRLLRHRHELLRSLFE
jgi:hypothetical protein